MKDEPLVSIALCTYNGEKYISQQLDSILNQTYSNLEIVILDDCSADGTFDIISSYGKKDHRIKCFKNEINLGFNKNFESAIRLTTSGYIAISDQDDIWLPYKIEVLMNHIAGNWLIFSNSSFINENNEVKDDSVLTVFSTGLSSYKGLLLANFVTGHTTLFKREAISYFLPFPENGYYDWWMGFVALYHQKIIFLNEILTHHRTHEASVIQKQINSGKVERQEMKAIDHMLSAFALYKHLEDADAAFITRMRDAYKIDMYRKDPLPLIKIIFNNYRELFVNHKIRKGLSLLNFAIKYAGRVKKYA